MSMLTVVRHGQASFDTEDYDQLSDLGRQQSRRLGKFWAEQGLRIDSIYTGPRVRQQQTAELAGIEYQQSAGDWPDPVMLPELDEYDLHGLFNCFAPRLATLNQDFKERMETYRSSVGRENRLRDFQHMFELLLHEWQRAEPTDDLESWSAFRGRVARVVHRIQNEAHSGSRVVLFSSGGFIGGIVQHGLNVANQTALELNWRIRNCSITEFLFTRDRFTLDNFNMVPHLPDPAMWTFR
ncbi:MAG: histidine phosphatase family protein [Planctomycetaceae bacterium]